jgi:dTDP-glucose 4,6-dehydratase
MLLVTGGAGFIGANFVLNTIATSGEPIVVLDALTYAANPANLESLTDDPRLKLVVGDIGDRPLVRSLLEQHQPRAVVHFAAESHVDRSIAESDAFVRTNVMGTHALLEESRLFWNQLAPKTRDHFRFLHVSTDEVFGSLGPADPAFHEQTPYAPNSPYSASKAASDHLVRAWHHTYGLPTLITNCSNNYGPLQFPEKLIPLTIHRALAGEPIPVYGDGSNVRDWLHVSDHCTAIGAVLERSSPGETWVIGGNAERRNLDLVHTLCDVLDRLSPDPVGEPYRRLITFVTDRPGHDQRYAIDASRLRDQLGWTPAKTFESGLEETVQWYLNHGDWLENVTSGRYRDWISQQYDATSGGQR